MDQGNSWQWKEVSIRADGQVIVDSVPTEQKRQGIEENFVVCHGK